MALIVARRLIAEAVVGVRTAHSAVGLVELLLRLLNERSGVVDELLLVTIILLLRFELLDVLRRV